MSGRAGPAVVLGGAAGDVFAHKERIGVAALRSELPERRRKMLEKRTREHLLRYERFAATLGLKSTSAFAVGTEVAVETERIASALIQQYPKALFVAGQIIFEEDTIWNRVLHNETAFLVQQRLQRRGIPMIVVPVRLDLGARRAVPAPKPAPA